MRRVGSLQIGSGGGLSVHCMFQNLPEMDRGLSWFLVFTDYFGLSNCCQVEDLGGNPETRNLSIHKKK